MSCTNTQTGPQPALHVPTTIYLFIHSNKLEVEGCRGPGGTWVAFPSSPSLSLGRQPLRSGRPRGEIQPASADTTLGWGLSHFIFPGPLVKLEEPRPRKPRAEGKPLSWVGPDEEARGPSGEEGCGRRAWEYFSSFTLQPNNKQML